MLGRWSRWSCGFLLACAVTAAGPASAQTAAETDKLNDEVIRLHRAGKYTEAIPIAQRALALREKALGPDHPDVGTSLNNLGSLHESALSVRHLGQSMNTRA